MGVYERFLSSRSQSVSLWMSLLCLLASLFRLFPFGHLKVVSSFCLRSSVRLSIQESTVVWAGDWLLPSGGSPNPLPVVTLVEALGVSSVGDIAPRVLVSPV